MAGPPPIRSLSSSCIEATLQNIGTFWPGSQRDYHECNLLSTVMVM